MKFEHTNNTMARKMAYRIYPLAVAGILGYLVGLLVIKVL